MSLTDIAVTAACLSLSCILYLTSPTSYSTPPSPTNRSLHPQGYILQNRITHSRLLPLASRHAFSYPTISLLLSVDALESQQLDLGRGWIFSYGGIRGRLIGLRSEPYLTHESGKQMPGVSIRQKLERILEENGYVEPMGDAWLMTMPSLLGFEGINPLTVYFCYRPDGQFWIVILEIHNTFGEAHLHILQIGKNEDVIPARGFDHQWTFHRQFHVSPFNDRSGFYTISVKAPSYAPSTSKSQPISSSPRPSVRVHLHETSPSTNPGSNKPTLTPGPLKLLALLHVTSSTPLCTPSLLYTLAKAPFSLLLTMPRILYNAWVLHYRKRLDVYIRPDPKSSASTGTTDLLGERVSDAGNVGIGVKWVPESTLERFARLRMEHFLRMRVQECGIAMTLVSGDPTLEPLTFTPNSNNTRTGTVDPGSPISTRIHLKIHYLSPRFFTALFISPSAWHALLLSGNLCKNDRDRTFSVSDEELFIHIFNSVSPPSAGPNGVDALSSSLSIAQRIRLRPLPARLQPPTIESYAALKANPNNMSSMSNPTIPSIHPLDMTGTRWGLAASVLALLSLGGIDVIEEWVFWLMRARIVSGEEPWMSQRWERAVGSLDAWMARALGKES